MKTEFKNKKSGLHIYLQGEIDHHSASLIRVSIDEAVSRKRPMLLVLDFDKVTFMDSSGIGLVMGRYKLMKSLGGKIKVLNLSPGAYKVMCLAGIERLGEVRQKEVVYK